MDGKSNVGLAAALGAITGFYVGKSLSLAAPPDSNAYIKISLNGNRYVSKTTSPLPVYGTAMVHWIIEKPEDFPDSAVVELRFDDDDSPFNTRRPKDKKYGKKRKIHERARQKQSLKPKYCYQVWYVNGGQQYLMEDPELQIEY